MTMALHMNDGANVSLPSPVRGDAGVPAREERDSQRCPTCALARGDRCSRCAALVTECGCCLCLPGSGDGEPSGFRGVAPTGAPAREGGAP